MAKLVEVIFTDDLKGKGTEEAPYYRAHQLWTKDGRLICEGSPHITAMRRKDGELYPVVGNEQSFINLEILSSL